MHTPSRVAPSATDCFFTRWCLQNILSESLKRYEYEERDSDGRIIHESDRNPMERVSAQVGPSWQGFVHTMVESPQLHARNCSLSVASYVMMRAVRIESTRLVLAQD